MKKKGTFMEIMLQERKVEIDLTDLEQVYEEEVFPSFRRMEYSVGELPYAPFFMVASNKRGDYRTTLILTKDQYKVFKKAPETAIIVDDEEVLVSKAHVDAIIIAEPRYKQPHPIRKIITKATDNIFWLDAKR